MRDAAPRPPFACVIDPLERSLRRAYAQAIQERPPRIGTVRALARRLGIVMHGAGELVRGEGLVGVELVFQHGNVRLLSIGTLAGPRGHALPQCRLGRAKRKNRERNFELGAKVAEQVALPAPQERAVDHRNRAGVRDRA